MEGLIHFIVRQMRLELYGHDLLKYFGKEREVGDRSVVGEEFSVDICFFQKWGDNCCFEMDRHLTSL